MHCCSHVFAYGEKHFKPVSHVFYLFTAVREHQDDLHGDFHLQRVLQTCMSLPLLQKDNYRQADSMDLFKWEKTLSLILGIWTEGDTPAGRRFPPKRIFFFWWKPEGEGGVSQHYFPPFPNLLGEIHMGHPLVTAIITEGTAMVPAKAVSRMRTRDLLEQI